jgi:hypothetical protein
VVLQRPPGDRAGRRDADRNVGPTLIDQFFGPGDIQHLTAARYEALKREAPL